MANEGDVVELIMNDHREVERLFSLIKDDPSQRGMLVPVVTSLLVAHSRAEESEVYPVARDEAGETEEVAHSQEEHEEAERLLEQLAAITDSNSQRFEDVFAQVVESVTHHVKEEEETVLPGMRQRLDEQRRRELGAAFMAVRAEHLGDEPGEATRAELLQQAENRGMTGLTSKPKDEIADELEP